MNIIIITGNNLRHEYFVNRISKDFNVVGVFRQTSTSSFNFRSLLKKIKNHNIVLVFLRLLTVLLSKIFKNDILINSIEKKYFESKKLIPVSTYFVKNINDESVVLKIADIQPDIILVFGGKLVSKRILAAAKKHAINLHTGQSPFYRGSYTNLWPFIYNDIGHCGFTLHLLDSGADSGNLLCRGRPEISSVDNRHTIFSKSVLLGIDELIKLLNYIGSNNKISSFPQKLNDGKLFLSIRYNFIVEILYYTKYRSFVRKGISFDQHIETFYDAN